jgi:formamidopyrimidine-DNA glycosylase
MPELPEAEMIARALAGSCRGACIEKIEILHPQIFDERSDLKPEWYEKAIIQKIERNGKQIILTLLKGKESGYIRIRLGMTGQVLSCDLNAPRVAHTHAVIRFVDGPFELHFRDPRRFGRILMRSSLSSFQQGAEPLTLPLKAFAQLMAQSGARIKWTLMNQKIIAGIGNIYANEMLFEAGIHPHQKANRLSPIGCENLFKAMKKVLRLGIRKRGTTIRDFRSLDGTYGRYGRFQKFLKVYGKEDQPCPRTGCLGTIRLIRTSQQAQPTFYCPHCQRKR